MDRFIIKNLGIIEWCIEDTGEVYIDYVSVDKPQNGHGKRLMNNFIKMIEREGESDSITLIACDKYGTPLEKLEKFYRGLGFKEIHRNNYGVFFKKVLQ